MTKIIASRRAWLASAAVAAVSVSVSAPAIAAAQEPPQPQPQGEAASAVAEIEKLGGRVGRDEESKEKEKPIIAVSFATAKIDEPGKVALVKPLASTLRKLTLNNNAKVADAALEHVKGLANLEKLYLVDTKVTDAGLDHLKDLKKLKVLSLVGTEVTDAGLEKIKALPELGELYLHGTKVTDDGVKKLKEAMPKLKVEK